MARAVVLVMERLDAVIQGVSVEQECPHCRGKGWTGDDPNKRGPGMRHTQYCTVCRQTGRVPTAHGEAVLQFLSRHGQWIVWHYAWHYRSCRGTVSVAHRVVYDKHLEKGRGAHQSSYCRGRGFESRPATHHAATWASVLKWLFSHLAPGPGTRP
jgi:hypothetical protein